MALQFAFFETFFESSELADKKKMLSHGVNRVVMHMCTHAHRHTRAHTRVHTHTQTLSLSATSVLKHLLGPRILDAAL